MLVPASAGIGSEIICSRESEQESFKVIQQQPHDLHVLVAGDRLGAVQVESQALIDQLALV